MKKRILAALLCAVMILSATACGLQDSAETEKPAATTEDAATEGPITLVYAEVNPLDTIAGMTSAKFKETVEELSGGSITIDLQAEGVLGSENDVVYTMLNGGETTIDLACISASSLTSYGGAKSKLLSLPYVFVSRDHFWAFAESELAQEILAEPAENEAGVRGLFYGEEGFRHFFTVGEIDSIDDLAGMKLRVSNDPVMSGLIEGLGASPADVSFTELYSALETGEADGAEQLLADYKANAFPEVASNLILDGHTLDAIQVIITDEAWNRLTTEQQEILVEAGKTASAYNKEITAAKEAELLQQLKDEGCNVVEVTDLTPWQEAAKGVIDANIVGLEDLYQQIVDLAK